MTCIEAEPHVSAVCDGETIPAEAAEHIGACAACRTILAEYAQMGTELRVAAAMDSKPLPSLLLPVRRRAFDFLWRRVPVPRFALAVMVAGVFAVAASVPLLRAQPRPLWFQFGYSLEAKKPISSYQVAKAGFDQTLSSMTWVGGALVSTVLRIKVERVSNDDVVVRCRAVPGKMEASGDGGRRFAFNGGVPGGVALNDASPVHYKPGGQLRIPIEGGGTIYLQGEISEQQPKIAFSVPLEPPSNQLVMRGPVLISEGKVLADMKGGTATALPGDAVTIAAGENGTFLFALKPFPGSFQGEMEWGQMSFTIDGRAFHLVAAAPLSSGVQPRPVWVRHDANREKGESIGTFSLGE